MLESFVVPAFKKISLDIYSASFLDNPCPSHDELQEALPGLGIQVASKAEVPAQVSGSA